MNFKITSLYAVVGIDEKDGDEGVWAFKDSESVWMPMVMADEARFRSILPLAIQMSKESNKPFKVIEFSERKDVTEEFIRQYS